VERGFTSVESPAVRGGECLDEKKQVAAEALEKIAKTNRQVKNLFLTWKGGVGTGEVLEVKRKRVWTSPQKVVKMSRASDTSRYQGAKEHSLFKK